MENDDSETSAELSPIVEYITYTLDYFKLLRKLPRHGIQQRAGEKFAIVYGGKSHRPTSYLASP